MAVKLESEKTAMLRRGMPAQPIRHGQSAKTQGGSAPTGVARKDSMPGRGKTMKSVGS